MYSDEAVAEAEKIAARINECMGFQATEIMVLGTEVGKKIFGVLFADDENEAIRMDMAIWRIVKGFDRGLDKEQLV